MVFLQCSQHYMSELIYVSMTTKINMLAPFACMSYNVMTTHLRSDALLEIRGATVADVLSLLTQQHTITASQTEDANLVIQKPEVSGANTELMARAWRGSQRRVRLSGGSRDAECRS